MSRTLAASLLAVCCALLLSGCQNYLSKSSIEVVDGCMVKIEGFKGRGKTDLKNWHFGDDCEVTVDGELIDPDK